MIDKYKRLANRMIKKQGIHTHSTTTTTTIDTADVLTPDVLDSVLLSLPGEKHFKGVLLGF